MKKTYNSQKGIGIIEVIVCLAVITTAFWGFLELTKYNLQIQEQSEAEIEAINLAAEALEAVRGIRNEDWNNLASLSAGTKYYPVISVNKWILVLADPGPINGLYDRWIILERVFRDANDNINPAGAEDAQTKKIIAFVEWTDQTGTKQIQLATYLTNWTN